MKFRTLIPVSLASVLALGGCFSTSGEAPRSSAVRQAVDGDHYVVRRGDTLFSIAFANGLDYRTLALINKLDPANAVIHPGDVLLVRIGRLNVRNVYRVRPGDTLFSVARRHGKSVEQMARINHLSPPYAINAGQLLILDPKKPAFERAAPRSGSSGSSPSSSSAARPGNVPVPPPSQGASRSSSSSSSAPSGARSLAAPHAAPASGAGHSQASPAPSSGRTIEVPSQKPAYNSRSRLTWQWPTYGTLIRGFSATGAAKGINIAGKKGQNIKAAASGKVVYAGSALRGYGNLIIIKHNDDYLSAYAHNDRILVKELQDVKSGQVIARMGDTDSNTVNLHFEIRYRGQAVNPQNYLPRR